MKGIVFATIMFSSLLAQSVLAQNRSVYFIEISEGEKMIEVLKEVEISYAISFAYESDIIEDVALPYRIIKTQSLDSLISKIMDGTVFDFQFLSPDRVLLREFQLYGNADPQSMINIAGKILDGESGTPVPDVAIYLDTTHLGTVSSQDGSFHIAIPEHYKNHSLQFSMIGFRSITIPVHSLPADGLINMKPEPYFIEEISVVSFLPKININSFEWNTKAYKSLWYPQQTSSPAGSDILRTVQLLPGISADDDLDASVKIRGSNSDETLLLLDGIPIYRSDHFYGIFSTINPAYVDAFELYKSVLPVAYGGKTGGMLLLNSNDKVHQTEISADINLLSTSLNIALPLTQETGIMLSGRKSYTDVTNSKFFDWVGNDYVPYQVPGISKNRLIETDPDFTFFDVNSKFYWNPDQRNHFEANFFLSRDDFENAYLSRYQINSHNKPTVIEDSYDNIEDWGNTGASIKYEGQPGREWLLTIDGYYTKHETANELNSNLEGIVRGDSVSIGFANSLFNNIHDTGARIMSTKSLQNSHLNFGMGFIHHHAEYTLATEGFEILDGRENGLELNLFSEYIFKPVEDFMIGLGMRATHYNVSSEFYFSPQVRMNYTLTPALSLKSAFGIQHQFVRELNHETRLGQSMDILVLSDDLELPVGKSSQITAGAEYQKGFWTAEVEFFYKDMDGVIEHASQNPGFQQNEIRPSGRIDYKVFSGTGKAYGLDLLLALQKKRYTGWIAYTLSKTTHSFDEILRGEPFPAQNDRRHQLKWINNVTLGRLTLSANYIFSSGKPYTNVAALTQQKERKNLSPGDRIAWLPNYHRIDLGAYYTLNLAARDLTFNISLLNATNHSNVKYLQYVYSLPGSVANSVIGNETNLLDRTLNLGLMLKF